MSDDEPSEASASLSVVPSSSILIIGLVHVWTRIIRNGIIRVGVRVRLRIIQDEVGVRIVVGAVM